MDKFWFVIQTAWPSLLLAIIVSSIVAFCATQIHLWLFSLYFEAHNSVVRKYIDELNSCSNTIELDNKYLSLSLFLKSRNKKNNWFSIRAWIVAAILFVLWWSVVSLASQGINDLYNLH